MIRVLIVGIFLFLTLNILAQSTQAFRHVTLDQSNGLRNDARNVFLGSDQKGFLWIGSEDGAYRFDGQNFTRFFVGKPSFDNTVKSPFFEDADGTIWYGTQSGIISVDSKTLSVSDYPLSEKFTAQFGYHLIKKGFLNSSWLASNGSELFAIEELNNPTPQKIADSKGVRHLMLDDQESLLGLSFPWLLKTGLEKINLDQEKGQITITESSDEVIRSAVISGGVHFEPNTVWLASDIGLIGYDYASDSTFVVSKVPLSGKLSRIWDVKIYGDLLLVASEIDGLWWFDPIEKKFLHKLKSNIPGLTDKPRALHISDKGEVLVSRATGGVDVLLPQRFSISRLLKCDHTEFHPIQILKKENSTAYLITPEGKIYHYLDHKPKLIRDLNFRTRYAEELHAALEPNGNSIVLIKNNKLYAINLLNGSIEYEKVLPVKNIKELLTLEHTLLIVSDSSLHSLSEGRLTKIDNSAITSTPFTKYHVNTKNLLSVSNGGKRILLTSINDSKLKIVDSIFISGEFICSSVSENSEEILIGTTQGLHKAKKGTPSNKWSADGLILANTYVNAIRKTEKGELWASTPQGLALYENQRWSWISDYQISEDKSYYADEFEIFERGEILVSSGNGIFSITEDSTFKERSSTLLLDKYWKNGVQQAPTPDFKDSMITLIRNTQDLQFSFSTVGIFSEEPIRIRYRVLGMTDSWHLLGEDQLLRLEPLPIGTFTLEVEVLSSQRTTNSRLEIQIEVLAPYWEKTWFRVLLLLTLPVAGGFVSFIVYRNKSKAIALEHARQILLSNERDRIARDLHDQLGTNLSTILFLSEDQGTSNQDRSKISRLSREALAKMREVVWTLSEESTEFESWVNDLLQLTKERCALHGITLKSKLQIPSKISKLELSREINHELTLLMREALENAIQHGNPRTITVEVNSNIDGSIVITLEDDGKGFNSSNVNAGLGLSNLNFRAKRIGGEVVIESESEIGTKIRLSFSLT